MVSLVEFAGNWAGMGDEVVIRESPQSEAGWWAGAPNVTYDAQSQSHYLYYRLRRPRGQGRGYEARLAVSRDGFTFEDIWTVKQQELNSPSLERGCLMRQGRQWILYLSYVHGDTDQWQIDRVVADRVEDLDVRTAVPVLRPADVQGHAVKDPFVVRVGPLWYMYVSYAPKDLLSPASSEDLHRSQDVFTTGLVRSHTGLAISSDGEHYVWQGEVLGSSPKGWDSLVSRLTGVMPVGGIFLGFYDGAQDAQENYEERGGLAVSGDLKTFYKVVRGDPWFASQFGSARYACPVSTPGGTILYYEAATRTGSHHLLARTVQWA